MRNVWCPHYNSQCLDRAVAIDTEDNTVFDCSGCPMSEDYGDRVTDPAVVREESLNCARLLLKVFPALERRFALGP